MNSTAGTRRIQRILAALTVLLVVLRLTSPYFHTDSPASHSDSAGIASAVCASCEVESTPISDSFDPIVLPVNTFVSTLAVSTLPANGPIIYGDYPLQLRGPPSVSL